ncbi:MAG: DNA cytosine methyltransferase [Alphaproteobacteria bacterium]
MLNYWDIKPFRFIDLFAGIGGIRIPFQEIGGKCVFTSEIDKYAVQTYKANFNDTPKGDIQTIAPDQIPPHDVILAGFPCQPFSMAGLKKGFDDNRGTLFFDILKIIDHHHPKIIFLENVKNFQSHDGGNTFKTIKNELENRGYCVFHKILNAKDFGVPQNRERIFIIAFSEKIKMFDFPEPSAVGVKLGDILEKQVDPKYTISDKLWEGHQRRKKEHKEKGNGFGYQLFNENSSHTSTISARYYKDGSEILIEQKHKNPRKITPKEASRLQGFPETFKIPVSDAQAYRQFGNSVCVPVIRAIVAKLKKHI